MPAQLRAVVRALRPPAVALISALSACSGPEPQPLDLEQISTDIVARGATPEQVAEALQLADLRGLAFDRPELEDEVHYDRGDYWHASALAFNGQLCMARRRWAGSSALARSAGAAESMQLDVEHTGFGDDERETWIGLTFDVLSLLDAGRSAAARELGAAEARTAWADLERATWDTRIAVDRARTELGATLASIDALTDLLASSDASVTRAELLHDRGRLSEGDIARLRGMVAEVHHLLHRQEVHLALHRRELADAAGLPPGAPALGAPTRETLEDLARMATPPRMPDARELLERSPVLRGLRLQYGVAEAVLRDEVARTRPGLRLGPALKVTDGDTLLGGVLELDLPQASALSGRVEAAQQAREHAREALEEALRASLARLRQARSDYDIARDALAGHVGSRDVETAVAWRAARARFDVDPAAVEGVGMALRDRAMALLDLLEVRHEVVLAWLDAEQAIGPEPRPLPGADVAAEARP
jgi:outer membrane protein TolC